MRLLILSDLHCHSLARETTSSFLVAGGLRSPSRRHPVQSLLDQFRTEAGSLDALLCPGDLADKICQTGFQHAWFALREIAAELSIPILVASLGNHDVDSRNEDDEPDPFIVAQNAHPTFPLADGSKRTDYFHAGVAVIDLGGEGQIILLNTVIDHFTEGSAKRGTFDEKRIEILRQALEGLPRSKVRIAVLHHHVALHSSPVIGDVDVLETGDQITDVLGEFGINLVVHGHKHHPRARYVDTSSGRLFVLGAGSFSAYLTGALATRTRNVFHVVEIAPSGGGGTVHGIVKTWEWQSGEGWRPATLQSASFPHLSGFGSISSVSELAAILTELAPASAGWSISPNTVLSAAPELPFLTPNEQIQLDINLRERGLTLDWETKMLLRLVG